MTLSCHNKLIKRVLIVEDHWDAAQVLLEVVQQQYPQATINHAASLNQAEVLLAERTFNMALIDIGLPDGSGLDLIRQMVNQQRCPIIIVTTIFDEEYYLFEALKAGASGYLLKGHSKKELANFLDDALQGRPPLSASIAQSVLAYFRTADLPGTTKDSIEKNPLTRRELQILTFIAKGQNVKQTAEILHISSHTVSDHVKNIYRKLNLHNRAEATAAAVSLHLI